MPNALASNTCSTLHSTIPTGILCVKTMKQQLGEDEHWVSGSQTRLSWVNIVLQLRRAAILADNKWNQRSSVKVKMSCSSTTVVLWVEFACLPKMASIIGIPGLQTLIQCHIHWILIHLKHPQSCNPNWNTICSNDETPARRGYTLSEL